jgi:hypothetical protein
MSVLSISTPNEKLQTKKLYEPRSLIYLPKEGLQGEDIPSHILWENVKVESVQISFRSPLRFKEIFNAESWETHDNEIIVKKVELDGYVGLSFESSKVSDLEVVVPVNYLINLSDGNMIKETKEIKLFRPQLRLEVQTKAITITPKTGFVKDRIKIKNIGRGTLIMYIFTEEDSPTKLETPLEHREFAEKFLSDLLEELSNLAKKFPQFQSILDDVPKWETKNLLELSDEERDKFAEYINRMANVLASDRDLLQGFVNAYGKALAKNSELIEAVRRVVKLYESLVSKDLLLINPFDEIAVTGKKAEITLKISRTDKVFDLYEDIILPKIELTSSEEVRVPIYKLFEWG